MLKCISFDWYVIFITFVRLAGYLLYDYVQMKILVNYLVHSLLKTAG